MDVDGDPETEDAACYGERRRGFARASQHERPKSEAYGANNKRNEYPARS